MYGDFLYPIVQYIQYNYKNKYELPLWSLPSRSGRNDEDSLLTQSSSMCRERERDLFFASLARLWAYGGSFLSAACRSVYPCGALYAEKRNFMYSGEPTSHDIRYSGNCALEHLRFLKTAAPVEHIISHDQITSNLNPNYGSFSE